MNYGPRSLQELFLTYAFVPHPPPPMPLSVPLATRLARPASANAAALVLLLHANGQVGGAHEQVAALHGCSVQAWVTAIVSAMDAAVARACSAQTSSSAAAPAAADERLVLALLAAEAAHLRSFLEHQK